MRKDPDQLFLSTESTGDDDEEDTSDESSDEFPSSDPRRVGTTGTMPSRAGASRARSVQSVQKLNRMKTNFALNEDGVSHALLPDEETVCGAICTVLIQILACTIYVMMNAALPIVRYLSKPADSADYSYSVGSVMIVTNSSNIIIGAILTKLNGGAFSDCLEWRPIVRSGHFAIMSAILVVLKFQVLIFLTATLATMLEQLKLVTLAVAAFLVFGKRYSSVQTMSLMCLLLAMCSYAINSASEDGGSQDILLGLIFQVSFVLVSTVSTILREFRFKGGSKGVVELFPLQQYRIAVPGLLVSIIYFIFLDGSITWKRFGLQSVSYMFNGWSRIVVCVIITMLAVDWLSNYIQKLLDSVVVQVLGCVTIPVVYALNYIVRPSAVVVGYDQIINLSLVVLIASSFALSTRYTNKLKDAMAKIEELQSEEEEHVNRLMEAQNRNGTSPQRG